MLTKSIVYLSADSFSGLLPQAQDALDAAIQVEEDMRWKSDPFWLLLRDLHSAGFGFQISDQFIVDVLEALAFNVVFVTASEKQRPMTFSALKAFAAEGSWVIDPHQLVRIDNGSKNPAPRMFFGNKAPLNPKAFKYVIELPLEDVLAKLLRDGTCLWCGNCTDRRFWANLYKELQEAVQPEKKRISRPEVIQPADKFQSTKNGYLTTLEAERIYYASLLAERLFDFDPPNEKRGSASILQILLHHCEEQISRKLSSGAQAGLERQIEYFMKRNEPIVINFAQAVMRTPNCLKFSELHNLPTQAWLHLAYFFNVVHAKIKTIYEPGIKIILFDEAMLFGELFGYTKAQLDLHLKSVRHFIATLNSPIEIFPMTKEMFNCDEAQQIKVDITNDRVYAIACSHPKMTCKEAMDPLYVSRQKNFTELRSIIGREIWDHAFELCTYINQLMTWRKNNKLSEKILVFPSIDACITDKDDRIVFDITAPATLIHGVPVLSRKKAHNKIQIIPEYRIHRGDHGKVHPVRLAVSELGLSPEEISSIGQSDILFYYLTRDSF